ncbi:hypothetical protein SAMN05216389_11234 [Oceanobacillus limi]|uniref:Uncharacterized protein n=1 Tax=Oceanobacillus limi TaxID=930131 RepID=A0A1I0EPI0_9BACI|nr:hypothetical protein [Oceanobacillus limi]SET47342.1 hypothetical protein SAMN05216389_11234 [Oceanobacillus limi]
MYFCPLCNGFESVSMECPSCESTIADQGKLADFFDDYSAYMDIDMIKLFDGDPKSLENHQCLHYFYCENCSHEEIKAVKEVSALH